MSQRILLGLDIGTSGAKVTAFDLDGQVVGTATCRYDTLYPKEGYVEQDPLDWWSAVCKGIHNLKHKQDLSVEEIAAIGVDGQSWACLPVDQQGRPLKRAMIWLDRRAESQAEKMRTEIGEKKLFELNGNPVDSAYIVPKMLWLKEHEPECYRRTYGFLQSNGFIVHRLTGEFSQDFSQGYGFHFFDIVRGFWDGEMADRLGISLKLVAPLYHCHKVVGTVTAEAARATGLVAGIPVVAGGLDAACCTLGAGVIAPGQTQEQGGQAGGMSIQVDNPLAHPRLILGYHVLPDQWLLQGGTVGGGSLRWFKEEFGAFEEEEAEREEASAFEIMSREASSVIPGSEGLIFLPYMAGERSPIWNSRARGVFFGLSYDKSRAHAIRAVMEGVGYALQHNLQTASEVGAEVEELVSVGGAANSRVWTQIKADITGKRIRVPFSDHATTLGAAILAGVGTGLYSGFKQAVERTVSIRRRHQPDLGANELYSRYYELYLELYNRLEGCYDRLHTIREKSNFD